MAPKRAQFAPRVRRTCSNLALKARLEDAMKKNPELKIINQSLFKRNKKLMTALEAIQSKIEAALEADSEDAAATALRVQELRDQIQSDLDGAQPAAQDRLAQYQPPGHGGRFSKQSTQAAISVGQEPGGRGGARPLLERGRPRTNSRINRVSPARTTAS